MLKTSFCKLNKKWDHTKYAIKKFDAIIFMFFIRNLKNERETKKDGKFIRIGVVNGFKNIWTSTEYFIWMKMDKIN